MTETKNNKIKTGVVVSKNMKDTVVVEVESYKKHPKYEKFLKGTKKFSVHDADNSAQVGDKVQIKEVKPISKTKKFTLVK